MSRFWHFVAYFLREVGLHWKSNCPKISRPRLDNRPRQTGTVEGSMQAPRRWTCLALLALLTWPALAGAQPGTTYHLHAETSTISSSNRQLKTAGPDVAATFIQSVNLKNSSNNASIDIEDFETASGVPNATGVIPAGSVVSFWVWMKKSANWGELYPEATLFRNNYVGAGSAFVCGVTHSSSPGQVTTTLQLFSFTCTTSTAVTMSPTDRFFLGVGVWLAQSPGNHNLQVELHVEGTLEGNYDSRVSIPDVVPAPAITNLDPSSGPVNWPVTISGSEFGTGGTVTFNGTPATPTNWTDTSITTSVPAGATSGPVVVTVGGAPSNGVAFTVIPPPSLTSLTPPSAHISDPVVIAGNNFLDGQGSSTVAFNGTPGMPTAWSNTSITVPVPSGATSGNVVVTVSGQASNGLPFTLIPPPTLSSVTPPTAHVGDPVTVTGTNFGASQGSSTVTFNGTAASPTTWSDTSITTPVPAGATTGNIVVTVANQPSNGLPFTVIIPGTVSGTVTRVTGGTGISGASVQAVLTGLVKGSATTQADGTYSIASLDPASYDVRVFASGFSSEFRQNIVVNPSTTTTLDVPMYVPGAVSGRVTEADGITPIVGAAVTVYAGPVQQGSTNTNASGDYVIGGLHPGGYTVQAANAGHATSEQGAVVAEDTTTTKNFSLNGAPAGPVLYAYDDLSRLVQVTDPSGESAVYRYDEIGNITAIERPGSTGVVISTFTPSSGLVGATVTIYGTGLDPTPGGNTVTFNGTSASVTSATPTELVVTVPGSATTGAIAVTTASGSATSEESFTVLAASAAPTISNFTPGTAASGTALTVNGSNFQTTAANNNVLLNLSLAQVTTATTTAIQATVPLSATTGRVSVSTEHGTAVSTEYLWVAPPPYAASDPLSTNLVAFEAATPVSVNVANKIALLAFEGTEGHRASVNITGNTGGTSYVHLYDPFGKVLRTTPVLTTAFLEPASLRSTATYSVVFDPQTTNTTSATLTVYDVPPDFADSIAPGGGSVVVPIAVPGQNGRLTFTETAGQRIALGQTGFNCFTATTTIQKPDGSTQASSCGGTFIDVQNLSASGQYTILVDPKGASVGSTTLTLYDVPPDDSGSVTINGPGYTLQMTAVAQNGFVTFSATQGQQARVHISGNTVNGFLDVSLVQLLPGGGETVLASTTGFTAQFDLPAQTLPATGDYKVVVSPKATATGSATVSVLNP